MKNLSPVKVANSLAEYWSPQVIASVSDCYVKVAKLKGSFVWHSHQEEDELFLVLKGELSIEYADKTVQLKSGDLHLVPKGAMHNPVAHKECLVMLIEHKETLHTGDIKVNGSKCIKDQLIGQTSKQFSELDL